MTNKVITGNVTTLREAAYNWSLFGSVTTYKTHNDISVCRVCFTALNIFTKFRMWRSSGFWCRAALGIV